MVAVPEDVYKCMCDILSNYCDENHQIENQPKIDKLKALFGTEINSNRRKENIQTIKQLIKVLEKRDCLSHTNVNFLYEIADFFHARHLIIPLTNCSYQSPVTETIHNVKTKLSTNQGTNEEIIKRKVHKVISEELGKSWIGFARALGMRECTIDQLKIDHSKSYKLCAINILEFHEEESHPRVWRSQLLQALRKARRNDLHNSVQNIFDTYS